MTQETHEALKLAENLFNNAESGSISTAETEEQAGRALLQMHALIVQMSNALMNAHDHIEMDKLRRSHSIDAARISDAIAGCTQYMKAKP